MVTIIKIRENEELADRAANWFHQKWGIPLQAYQESIRDCLKNENAVPQWYLATDHTSFYERYGWEFLCMVQGDGESELSRMYIHR